MDARRWFLVTGFLLFLSTWAALCGLRDLEMPAVNDCGAGEVVDPLTGLCT